MVGQCWSSCIRRRIFIMVSSTHRLIQPSRLHHHWESHRVDFADHPAVARPSFRAITWWPSGRFRRTSCASWRRTPPAGSIEQCRPIGLRSTSATLDSLVVAIRATRRRAGAGDSRDNVFSNPPTKEDELLMLACEHNSRTISTGAPSQFEHSANACDGRHWPAAGRDGRGCRPARMDGRRSGSPISPTFSGEGRRVLVPWWLDSVRSLVRRRIATGFRDSRTGH